MNITILATVLISTTVVNVVTIFLKLENNHTLNESEKKQQQS